MEAVTHNSIIMLFVPFLKWLYLIQLGVWLDLSTGAVGGVVEENYQGFPLRPKVKLIKSGEEVSLLNHLDLVIEGIVYSA